MSKAIEAVAVAIWERDPDMSAPSDAVGRAEGIIAALKANGYAVVPVEPTEAMFNAGVGVIYDAGGATNVADIYRAMIAAATHDDGGE